MPRGHPLTGAVCHVCTIVLPTGAKVPGNGQRNMHGKGGRRWPDFTKKGQRYLPVALFCVPLLLVLLLLLLLALLLLALLLILLVLLLVFVGTIVLLVMAHDHSLLSF